MADLSKAKKGDKLKTQKGETFVVSSETKTQVKCECGARFMKKSGVQVGSDGYIINGVWEKPTAELVAPVVEAVTQAEAPEVVEVATEASEQEAQQHEVAETQIQFKSVSIAEYIEENQCIEYKPRIAVRTTHGEVVASKIKSQIQEFVCNEFAGGMDAVQVIVHFGNDIECDEVYLDDDISVYQCDVEQIIANVTSATAVFSATTKESATSKTDGETIGQTEAETSDFKFLQRIYELDIEFTEKYGGGVNHVINCGTISKNGVSAHIVQYETGLCEITPVDSTWATVCSGNLNAVLHLFNLVATSSK